MRAIAPPRASINPSPSRSATSAPPHQPASVGRSWVVTQATAGRDSRAAARTRAPSRSNHSTRMPRMSARRQLLAEAVGHGAEVLADHHALRALALQRDLADQVVDGIGDIGALGRVWRPSGMTNSRVRPIAWSMRSMPAWRMLAANSAEKPRQPSRAPASGSGGGRFQIWPVGRERVGRRADGDACAPARRARPALGAVGRRADREIAIEADLEPAGFRARGRRGELAVGEPLAEYGEGDRLGSARPPSRASAARSASRSGCGPAAPILAAALAPRSPRKSRSGATPRRPRRRSAS